MNGHDQKHELMRGVELYREAIEKNEDDAWAYCHLGVTLSHLGAWGQAVESLLEAIRIVPDFALAHRHLGIIYGQMGHRMKAAQHLETATRLECEAQSLADGRRRKMSQTSSWILQG